MFPDLSDAEIDDICSGLKQNAAKVRHLIGLGLTVDRKQMGGRWSTGHTTRRFGAAANRRRARLGPDPFGECTDG